MQARTIQPAPKRILIAAPAGKPTGLAEPLREHGFHTVEIPCIQTKPLPHNIRLGQAISEMESYSWMVFTDTSAVQAFFDELLERRVDVRRLTTIKFAVANQAVRQAVERHGVLVEYMPLSLSLAALANGLANRVHQKEKVLLLRGCSDSKEITEIFAAHFIAYDDIPAYQNLSVSSADWTYSKEDTAVFLSASAVQAFVRTMGLDGDYEGMRAVCIDQQTEKEAQKYKMNTVVSLFATKDSLVRTVLEWR